MSTKRKIVQIAASERGLYALADDGTVWERYTDPVLDSDAQFVCWRFWRDLPTDLRTASEHIADATTSPAVSSDPLNTQ